MGAHRLHRELPLLASLTAGEDGAGDDVLFRLVRQQLDGNFTLHTVGLDHSANLQLHEWLR